MKAVDRVLEGLRRHLRERLPDQCRRSRGNVPGCQDVLRDGRRDRVCRGDGHLVRRSRGNVLAHSRSSCLALPVKLGPLGRQAGQDHGRILGRGVDREDQVAVSVVAVPGAHPVSGSLGIGLDCLGVLGTPDAAHDPFELVSAAVPGQFDPVDPVIRLGHSGDRPGLRP